MMLCNYKLFSVNVVTISKQMLSSMRGEMVHFLALITLFFSK